MKIFAFADMHGSKKALRIIKKKIQKENPDIVLCAGDFTLFGDSMRDILSEFNRFGKKVFIVHGNHESANRVQEQCRMFRNLMFIHKRTAVEKDVLVLGYGGGGFSYTDREFDVWVKKIKKRIEEHNKIVLLTHAPPHGTKIDVLLEGHCGSKSYRKFINQNTSRIKLVVSGHIHETSGITDYVGPVKLLNPGPSGKTIKI